MGLGELTQFSCRCLLQVHSAASYSNVPQQLREMALPRDTHKKLGSLLAVAVLAWLVQLVGLVFLQRYVLLTIHCVNTCIACSILLVSNAFNASLKRPKDC